MRSKGFTMVELMIVAGIIAILASMATLRYRTMLEKSREGATKSNAAALRVSVALYYGDREGIWPTTLNASEWDRFLMSVYLNQVPPVALSRRGWGTDPGGNDVSYLAPGDAPHTPGHGWAYDRDSGRLYVNSTDHDASGASYTTY